MFSSRTVSNQHSDRLRAQLNEMWEEMRHKSFHPRQWYFRDDVDSQPSIKGSIMWVFRPSQDLGKFEVGFFDPRGEWVPVEVGVTQTYAANKVHFLNGGN